MKKLTHYSARMVSAALLITGAVFGTTLAGCGGGGETQSDKTSRASAPTDATRARVESLLAQSIQSLASSGTQTLSMAQERFGSASSPPPSGDAGGSGAGAGISGGGTTPYLGAFFRQNAVRGMGRVAASRQSSGSGGDSSGSRPVEDPIPTPSFYYDYYLGLWVATTETPEATTYTLYEDEAKQKPAGFILTEQPADYETFPRIYRSSYEFTAGYLAGAHGHFNTTTNADYSGTSEHENVYADGGKSVGNSRWGGGGDSTYKSREDMASGAWSESVGTFRNNGSGGTRFTTSDGYGAEYTFNADGSGRGRITGREPGLPATIVWDARGNSTITYADGTIERFKYGFGFWGGYANSYGDDGLSSSDPSALEPDPTAPEPTE